MSRTSDQIHKLKHRPTTMQRFPKSVEYKYKYMSVFFFQLGKKCPFIHLF